MFGVRIYLSKCHPSWKKKNNMATAKYKGYMGISRATIGLINDAGSSGQENGR